MTPVTKSTEGSREKLIEATMELMSAHGFEPMGISSILEKAGVTKSNFYYHFKSKEELCLAALDELENIAFNEILLPIFSDESKTPKERLHFLFNCMKQKMTEECCNRGCPFVNLATETSDFHPLFREKIESYFSKYKKHLSKLIKEGVEIGEFRDDLAPDQSANLLLATINGTIVLAKVQKDTAVMTDAIESALKLISKN